MTNLHPAKETQIALAIEYAELMDYKALKNAYKTPRGTKYTISQISKLLLELDFITKIKNKCILDMPKIYKANAYLHTKIHKPVEVGVQIRLII